jgi:hypothetical protein
MHAYTVEEYSVKALYCQCSPISKRGVLEGSQALPACRSESRSVQMKMSMEHWWDDTDRGKP